MMTKIRFAVAIAFAMLTPAMAVAQVNEIDPRIDPFADREVTDLKSADPGQTSYINVGYSDIYRGHTFVDLGLSVCWATVNLGERKGDSGSVLGWGEYQGPREGNYTEQNSNNMGRARRDISGNVDFDAATKVWGGKWRTPTRKEMEELRKKCKWTWITSPIRGYKVTSKKNGNSIYLPAWGRFVGKRNSEYHVYGYYWTSTPCNGNHNSAYRLSLGENGINVLEGLRYEGCNIRPVFTK